MIRVQYLVWLWPIVAPMAALPAGMEAKEIIRLAVAADERNWKLVRNYAFSERVDSRRLDSEGQVKSRDVSTYEVLQLEGSPYRRLAARHDTPLPAADERREQAKLARSMAERARETGDERARRVSEYQRRPEWLRIAWRELPDAFDFRMANEENDTVYVIEARPRPGYEARSRTAQVLAHLHGKLWIDKKDHQLVKAEVEVVDTISVGFFLVRLAKGSRAALEQTRINNEVWLPQRVHVLALARLGLLKVLNVEHEVRFSAPAGSLSLSSRNAR